MYKEKYRRQATFKPPPRHTNDSLTDVTSTYDSDSQYQVEVDTNKNQAGHEFVQRQQIQQQQLVRELAHPVTSDPELRRISRPTRTRIQSVYHGKPVRVTRPIRPSRYLKSEIGSLLTNCLTTVCELRPEDPIDFIAHFLYKIADAEFYYYEKAIYNKECMLLVLEYHREQARKQKTLVQISNKMKELSNSIMTARKHQNKLLWPEMKATPSRISKSFFNNSQSYAMSILSQMRDSINMDAPMSEEITISKDDGDYLHGILYDIEFDASMAGSAHSGLSLHDIVPEIQEDEDDQDPIQNTVHFSLSQPAVEESEEEEYSDELSVLDEDDQTGEGRSPTRRRRRVVKTTRHRVVRRMIEEPSPDVEVPVKTSRSKTGTAKRVSLTEQPQPGFPWETTSSQTLIPRGTKSPQTGLPADSKSPQSGVPERSIYPQKGLRVVGAEKTPSRTPVVARSPQIGLPADTSSLRSEEHGRVGRPEDRFRLDASKTPTGTPGMAKSPQKGLPVDTTIPETEVPSGSKRPIKELPVGTTIPQAVGPKSPKRVLPVRTAIPQSKIPSGSIITQLGLPIDTWETQSEISDSDKLPQRGLVLKTAKTKKSKLPRKVVPSDKIDPQAAKAKGGKGGQTGVPADLRDQQTSTDSVNSGILPQTGAPADITDQQTSKAKKSKLPRKVVPTDIIDQQTSTDSYKSGKLRQTGVLADITDRQTSKDRKSKLPRKVVPVDITDQQTSTDSDESGKLRQTGVPADITDQQTAKAKKGKLQLKVVKSDTRNQPARISSSQMTYTDASQDTIQSDDDEPNAATKKGQRRRILKKKRMVENETSEIGEQDAVLRDATARGATVRDATVRDATGRDAGKDGMDAGKRLVARRSVSQAPSLRGYTSDTDQTKPLRRHSTKSKESNQQVQQVQQDYDDDDTRDRPRQQKTWMSKKKHNAMKDVHNVVTAIHATKKFQDQDYDDDSTSEDHLSSERGKQLSKIEKKITKTHDKYAKIGYASNLVNVEKLAKTYVDHSDKVLSDMSKLMNIARQDINTVNKIMDTKAVEPVSVSSSSSEEQMDPIEKIRIQQECERKMKTVFKEIERLNESVVELKEKEEVYTQILDEEIEEATTIKKKITHKLAKAHWGAVKTTVDQRTETRNTVMDRLMEVTKLLIQKKKAKDYLEEHILKAAAHRKSIFDLEQEIARVIEIKAEQKQNKRMAVQEMRSELRQMIDMLKGELANLNIDQTNLEKDEDDSDIPSIYVEFLEKTMRRLSAALAEKMKAFEELQQNSGISEGTINLSDVVQLEEEIQSLQSEMMKLQDTLTDEEKLTMNLQVDESTKEKISETRQKLQKVDTFITKKEEAKEHVGLETNQMISVLIQKKKVMDEVKQDLSQMVRATKNLKDGTRDAINKIQQTKQELDQQVEIMDHLHTDRDDVSMSTIMLSETPTPASPRSNKSYQTEQGSPSSQLEGQDGLTMFRTRDENDGLTFYTPGSDSCEHIGYSGYSPDRNSFATRKECEKTCVKKNRGDDEASGGPSTEDKEGGSYHSPETPASHIDKEDLEKELPSESVDLYQWDHDLYRSYYDLSLDLSARPYAPPRARGSTMRTQQGSRRHSRLLNKSSSTTPHPRSRSSSKAVQSKDTSRKGSKWTADSKTSTGLYYSGSEYEGSEVSYGQHTRGRFGSDSDDDMDGASWGLNKRTNLMCNHPVLGTLKPHAPKKGKKAELPSYWDSSEFSCRSFYHGELYSVCGAENISGLGNRIKSKTNKNDIRDLHNQVKKKSASTDSNDIRERPDQLKNKTSNNNIRERPDQLKNKTSNIDIRERHAQLMNNTFNNRKIFQASNSNTNSPRPDQSRVISPDQ